MQLPEGTTQRPLENGSRVRVVRLRNGAEEQETREVNSIARSALKGAAYYLKRFYYGGLREIDPASLVASDAVRVPEVWPAEAGLLQLEDSGAIRAPTAEEIAAWAKSLSPELVSRPEPNYLKDFDFHFAVTRATKLPADLYGAHLKNFLLLPGVPRTANRGHGCIGSAELGLTENLPCLDSEAIFFKPPDDPQKCRVLDVPASASVTVVSVYEPERRAWSFWGHRGGPVGVELTGAGDFLLVLNSSEAVNWQVTSDP